jgi:hypothetical protein
MRELIHENGRWNWATLALPFRDQRSSRGRSAAYPQNFILLPVKDMCRKGSVRPEPLSAHRFAKPAVMFCHVSNQVTLRVHDYVSICLLEAQEQVHHLNLSLYDQAGGGQKLCRRML